MFELVEDGIIHQIIPIYLQGKVQSTRLGLKSISNKMCHIFISNEDK